MTSCSPSWKRSDYAEPLRRNVLCFKGSSFRHGIIRLSALWILCRYRHNCHATRHKSRLDRSFGRKRWGDEGYAAEELVAELGACFLCADLGIALEPRDDHAAYLKSWLEVLRNNNRAIFTAASHAQRAAEYLHSLQPQTEQPDIAVAA